MLNTTKLIIALGLISASMLASAASAENVSYLVQLSYQSHEPNDNKYDDLYGSASLNGSTVWRQSSSQHTNLFKYQTVSLGSKIINFNSSASVPLILSANLMDYDSTSRDDTIGNWWEVINLNNIYAEMARNFSRVQKSGVDRKSRLQYGVFCNERHPEPTPPR